MILTLQISDFDLKVLFDCLRIKRDDWEFLQGNSSRDCVLPLEYASRIMKARRALGLSIDPDSSIDSTITNPE